MMAATQESCPLGKLPPGQMAQAIPRVLVGPKIRPESEELTKCPVSIPAPDVCGCAPASQAGAGEQVGGAPAVKSAPCYYSGGSGSQQHRGNHFLPLQMEKLSPRGQRGLLPRPSLTCGSQSASASRLLSDPSCASWYFESRHLPQFGKLFLPQTGAARTPVPRPPEHVHPHSQPQILGSRRGGRASVRGCGGHLYPAERSGRGAPPHWGLVGEDPSPPRCSSRGPMLFSGLQARR